MSDKDASIISEKYRNKYSKENRDWLGSMIDDLCTTPKTKEVTVKDEDGNETTETKTLKGTTLNLESLFTLAEANGIKAHELYGDQIGRKNAPGRLRMTLGNMLRAVARRRHGLYDLEGNWVEADAAFVGDSPLTETPEGEKIRVEKEEQADAA